MEQVTAAYLPLLQQLVGSLLLGTIAFAAVAHMCRGSKGSNAVFSKALKACRWLLAQPLLLIGQLATWLGKQIKG